MTYIEQHTKLPAKIHFSTITETDYPYISHTYTIKCKESNHFKPRSEETIHFHTSQSKITLTYTLNWKIILNFIHQFHSHTSYKNIKMFFTS